MRKNIYKKTVLSLIPSNFFSFSKLTGLIGALIYTSALHFLTFSCSFKTFTPPKAMLISSVCLDCDWGQFFVRWLYTDFILGTEKASLGVTTARSTSSSSFSIPSSEFYSTLIFFGTEIILTLFAEFFYLSI